MIFADKLILLRKKAGWSQEELADQMNVTRQSVSKWEGAQSVPDLEKMLRLSELFGVSTDYLLKDEIEEAEHIDSSDNTPTLRRVWASYEKLLQEGEYSKENKEKPSLSSAIYTAYWVIAAAVYLGYSLSSNNWGQSWIIWVVAGVIFPAVVAITNAFEKKSK